MRLLMLATGPFAAPTFRGLFETHHTVVALVAAPIAARKGSRTVPIGPVRDVAHEHGTPVFAPDDINDPSSQERLARFDADLMVVSDYGQILSASTLATARLGGMNLHASLLPKYRGAAPINWAVYCGDTETGVTVIHMTPRVDAGPCIAQARTPIDPEETAVALEARLSEIGAWLVRRVLDSMEAGRLEVLPQDPALASKAPRLKKTDGVIDWSRSAAAIKNQVRAMEPWPKTYTFWRRGDGPPVRLILGPVALIEPQYLAPGEYLAPGDSPGAACVLGDSPGAACVLGDSPGAAHSPGTVLEAGGSRLVVAAGSGAVSPRSIQPAGKRMMSVEEFLRGYHVQPGDRFGPE